MWKEYYPWDPSKEIYTETPPKTLASNAYFLSSIFSDIAEASSIYIEASIITLIERCSFSKCSPSNSEMYVVYINMLDSGICSFYKTIFQDCINLYDNGYIMLIAGNSVNLGATKLSRIVSSNCKSKIAANTRNIRVQTYGSQELEDSNISECSSSLPIFGLTLAKHANVARCLVSSNHVTVRVIALPCSGAIKKSNFVNNTEETTDVFYGLLSSNIIETFIVENCYIIGNRYQALSFIATGSIIYSQCYIDDTTKSSNVQIVNSFRFNSHQVPMYKEIISDCAQNNFVYFSIPVMLFFTVN